MASNTSNALGMAKQFGSQPKRTYEKQLKGVTPNYYVDTADYSDDDRIGRGLTALGVRLGENALQHEKNLLTFAEATTDQVLMNATEEEKRKLSSAELLVKGGVFDPEDNPYNIAILDAAKGKQTMRQIKLDYDVYAAQQKLSGNADEAIKSYEEFAKERMEEYGTEATIENKYAYNLGAADVHERNVYEVASDFAARKKEENKLIRREGILTDIEGVLANSDLITPAENEDFSKGLEAVVLKIKATATNDPNEEIALLKTVAQRTAEKGVEALNVLSELTIDGVKFKDTVDLEGDFERAKAYDVKNKAERIHGYRKELDKCETYETGMKMIEGVPDEHDREILREQWGEQFSIKRAAAKRSRQTEINNTIKGAKNLKTVSYADNFYTALKNGNQYIPSDELDANGNPLFTKTPTGYTASYAKAQGFDADVLAEATLDKLRGDIAEGDFSAIVPVLQTPLVGDKVRNFIEQNFDRDVQVWSNSGVEPESISMMRTMYEYAPNSMYKIVGQERADQLMLLDTILRTYPDAEQGVEAYATAMDRLNNKISREELVDHLLEQAIDVAVEPEYNYAYESGKEDEGWFGFFASNPLISLEEEYNREIDNRIDKLALAYHALGRPAPAAQAKAQQDVLSGYMAYGNSFIDMELITPIDPNKHEAAKYFGETLSEFKSRVSNGRGLNYIQYDKENDKIKYVWGDATVTTVSASDLVKLAHRRVSEVQKNEYELWQWNKGEG